MSSSLENSASTRVIGYARPVLLIIALLALTGIGLGAFRRPPKRGGRSRHPRSTNRMMRLWGVQGVYQHVRGVTNAVSGYSGGDKETAQYETVSTGTTGHEQGRAIQVQHDARNQGIGF